MDVYTFKVIIKLNWDGCHHLSPAVFWYLVRAGAPLNYRIVRKIAAYTEPDPLGANLYSPFLIPRMPCMEWNV
jgi:hypothetical protein